MAKWKLCRQTYGDDIYEFTEGDEVTIGRGTQNTIILPSLNISRKHCIITVKKDEVIIEDLKSANGIFVGLKKIPSNVPFSLSNNDIIGLGWTDGAPLAKVNDAEKFVFKLLKTTNDPSITDRIQFQNENEALVIPTEILNHSMNLPLPEILKPYSNLSLKRKSNTRKEIHNETNIKGSDIKNLSPNSIDNDNNMSVKKFKYNFVYEDAKEEPIIKIENEDEKYEAFNIKQECLDDEVQVIDSDSDSEQWYIRLSQNSPRKSFSTFNETRKSEDYQQDSSYSQLDDDVVFVENEIKCEKELKEEEEYEDDLFTMLPQPINVFNDTSNKCMKTGNEIINKNENNLTPDLKRPCYNSTEKSTPLKYLSPILNQPVHDEISSNKTKTGYEINKNNENNLIPIKSPSIKMYDGTSAETTKTNYKNLMNTCTDTNKQGKETKHMIICEADTKKSYKSRKIQVTDHKSPCRKSSHYFKGNTKNTNYHNKSSTSKIQITNSQKEERKKKLREIAAKDKGDGEQLCNSTFQKNEECGITISKVSAKITTSNRGAFLIDSKLISKPTNKRKVVLDNNVAKKNINSLTHVNECKKQDDINITKNLENNETTLQTELLNDIGKKYQKKTRKKTTELKAENNKHVTLSTDSTRLPPDDISDTAMNRRYSDNITKDSEKKNHSASINNSSLSSENKILISKKQAEKPYSNIIQVKQKEDTSLGKSSMKATKNSVQDKTSNTNWKETAGETELQIPSENIKPALKSSSKTILKPMKENKEPKRKIEKRVTFSDTQPEILEFEIEHGNQMKKTCNVKSILQATQHNMPVFSLQKIALMKILRWNPQWLEEQNNFSEPPPILGHNNVTMGILHSFSSHCQYVELVGDLLLMEIWECLTQGYIKTCNENTYRQMRIESHPLASPQRRGLELISLNVNVSVPTVQAHTIPREGEIMMFQFGEDRKICRFFFVHNVRCLPSPPNNVNSFYSISLQTSFTEKIMMLQRGAVVYGRSLAYINKDLRLFEAMEYLSRSPLSEVILNPQRWHFLLDEADRSCNMESQWTQPLNDSQSKAVMCAVSAAQGERPRIHMIQGPPGTGKSRVICAIVMEYFYDAADKKKKNLGKILLCATSNAAVDELVIRLLDIRQSLPHPERLKLVRVGRVEAMHPRARDISSLKLAQRDVARLQPDPALQPSALSAEISLLEAKKNMWQTKAMSTEDDARKAYCQNRVAEFSKKIAMFRSGGGGAGAGCAPQQLAHAERRVLEGADVVLTTLASAHSYKMRGLVGRIALCVVDEAGQAIEPETLIPLTLGVTRLALVGDPQQLPGFICSQRAKQHGLGESLFSRLTSCAEAWGEGGPILLDRQYRMHPHIADYPNRAFYEGRVQNETAHTNTLKLDTAPYFVLGIISADNGQDASGANEAEAWGVARVALALRSHLHSAVPSATPSAHSLAVITPYAAQRDLVRRHLRTLLQSEGGGSGGGEEGEVEVNTVDSFQGQERSVVVVSLARSHGLGFLSSAGRMNVMLTRAKHALVLCLNPRALEKNHQWRSLVEDAQKRNLYGTLPLHMCRPPSVHQVSKQEILQYLSPPVNVTRNPPHQSFRSRPNRKYRRRHKHGKN